MHTLRRQERLRGKKRVQRVSRQGRLFESPLLVMRYHPRQNEREERRMMVAVSRRCGGAVRRNRLKRLVREVYRQERHRLPVGGDFMLIVRAGAADASYDAMVHSFTRLADAMGTRVD